MSNPDPDNATPVSGPEAASVGDAHIQPASEPQTIPGESTPPPEPDPYDPCPWTMPYRFKKGHKHPWAGKPNYRRSMRERIRAMVASPAKDMTFAREIALRLGLTPEMVDKADLGDILAVSGMMHAVRGKAPYFIELMNRLDGRPGSTFVDVEPKPVDPTGTSDLEAEKNSAINLYRAIVSDPNASVRDKLDAQSALNELLGLVQKDQRSDRERASTLLEAMRQVGEF